LTRMNNVRKITKFKRSIRAISPVIATLLMIAIAVVASLVVYAWVNGYMSFQTSKAGKAIAIPSFALADNGNMIVYVQNVGQGVSEVSAVYINDELKTFSAPNKVIAEGNTIELTVSGGPYDKDTRYDIKVTTTDGTPITTTGKPGTGGSTSNPQTPSVVVTSFAITAPVAATDDSVPTSSSFTVTAQIHVSSGSVSVAALLFATGGYTITAPATVTQTVGTTDGTFTWTVTAPSSASTAGVLSLSATSTGYTAGTGTINVVTDAATPSVVVTSFAITAPVAATDNSIPAGISFTVTAQIHVSSGSGISVSATPTVPSGYTITAPATVTHSAGSTDVSYTWTVTAPSSASASAAVTLSATATGYTTGTSTFNVITEAPYIVVSNFAITAPTDAIDGTVSTSESFTVTAMIHVSVGSSVSVAADLTVPTGYTITSTDPLSHTVGTTDVSYVWTVTAPSSASASAAVTLSATATGYTAGTGSFNVVTSAPITHAVSFSQTGSGATVTVSYQINGGTTQTGNCPFSVQVTEGQSISYTYPASVSGSSTVRYILSGSPSPTSPQTVGTSGISVSATYTTQTFGIDVSDSNAATTASVSVTLSNCKAGDLIVVLGSANGNLPTSISDNLGTHLGWGTARDTVDASSHQRLADYSAVYTAGGSITITITWASADATNGHSVIAFAISGANTATPFDTHAGLPYSATGTSNSVPSISGVATTNQYDMIIGLTGSRATTTQTAGTNYNLIESVTSTAGSAAAEYQIVSTAQTSATVSFGTSTTSTWAIIADAIQRAW
jgi:flagellin-like protein